MQRLRTYLIGSQATLFILLIICSFIDTNVVKTNGGVSNFGNYPATVALYSLGFSLCVLFLWLAADYILQKSLNLKNLAYVIFLLGLLYLMVLLSTFPRHFSYAYSRVHDYLGIALYSVEFFLSLWIILKKYTTVAIALFSLEVIGMFIGLFSLLKFIHFLYIGQLIGALGFALILIVFLPPRVKYELNKTKQ